MLSPIVFLITLGVRILRTLFRTREELLIENLALRQQVIALKKKRPRPVLDDMDRAFWVALRAAWPGWTSRLFIVHPDTVAKWHRDRFRRYWAKISPHKPGRPRVDAEIRRNVLAALDLDGAAVRDARRGRPGASEPRTGQLPPDRRDRLEVLFLLGGYAGVGGIRGPIAPVLRFRQFSRGLRFSAGRNCCRRDGASRRTSHLRQDQASR